MNGLLARVAAIPGEFNSDVAVDLFDNNLDVLQYVVVGYLLLVSYGATALEVMQYGGHDPAEDGLNAEAVRQHRAPREAVFQGRVRQAMRVWNLVLSVFSLMGCISSFHLLGYLFHTRSFYLINCEFDNFAIYDGECAFWVFAFMISKIPEMMDTVFLILQKKRVIFLHSYHHLTVTVFCWYAGRTLYPPGMLFTAMNFAVHTVMYAYYLLSSFKALRRATAVVAPLVTALQIAQMIAGFGISLYVAFFSLVYQKGGEAGVRSAYGGRVLHTCEADQRVTRMGLLMYGSYFFLFTAFFASKYLGKSSRMKAKAKATAKATATDTTTTSPQQQQRQEQHEQKSCEEKHEDEDPSHATVAALEAAEKEGDTATAKANPNG